MEESLFHPPRETRRVKTLNESEGVRGQVKCNLGAFATEDVMSNFTKFPTLKE